MYELSNMAAKFEEEKKEPVRRSTRAQSFHKEKHLRATL